MPRRAPLSDHERALAHVKRVFGLEDEEKENSIKFEEGGSNISAEESATITGEAGGGKEKKKKKGKK